MGVSYEEVSVLLGESLIKIENNNNKELFFHTTDGNIYKMYHEQEFDEDVYIEDIIGDLDDLVGLPIIMAEETSQNNSLAPEGENEDGYGTYTWTFYKFATNKGYVTIRWYGESTGFYSESVEFALLGK